MTNVTDNGTNVIPLDDTREKLEADVWKLSKEWNKNASFWSIYTTVGYAKIIDLLDRQAAITQRECIDRWDAKAMLEIVELQARVDELQDQVDRYASLVRCLKRDHGINASWDNLRGFWNIEITEEHMNARDALAAELADVERTHMRLPVDADGAPIRIGDEMEWTNKLNGEKERFVCAGYTTEYSTWKPNNLALMATNEEGAEFYCDQCRHVQPDIVESLLEEFHGKLWSDDEEQMALLEEYAERIRKAVEHG